MIEKGLKYLLNIGATVSGVKVAEEGGVPFMALDKSQALETVEKYMQRPVRARGSAVALSSESFAQLYLRLQDEVSVVTASLQESAVEAVLNYENKDDPNWNDHRIIFRPQHSLAWGNIKENNRGQMEQVDFAGFLEEMADYTKDAAKLQEIALKFRAIKSVNFKSDKVLSNGSTEFSYEETVSGKSGKAQVPDTITFRCQIYQEEDIMDITAKLRYRLYGGNLTFYYEVYRIADMERAAFKLILNTISDITKKDIIYANL